MKVIAHTTGSFQLIDNLSGDLVSAHRPSVVSRTSFITARLAIGQLAILTEVPDAAKDEEFAKHWKESDGDMELAVQSFISTFEQAEDDAPETPRAPARGGKKQTPAATE
jgi:hypothetical protein